MKIETKQIVLLALASAFVFAISSARAAEQPAPVAKAAVFLLK